MAKAAKKTPAKKAAKSKTVAKKAPAKKSAAKQAAPKETPADKKPRAATIGEEAVIRVLKDENPRRPGTFAHAHFEKMKGGITVGAYLKKFKPEERRGARQWLTNTIRDGHAKVLGA